MLINWLHIYKEHCFNIKKKIKEAQRTVDKCFAIKQREEISLRDNPSYTTTLKWKLEHILAGKINIQSFTIRNVDSIELQTAKYNCRKYLKALKYYNIALEKLNKLEKLKISKELFKYVIHQFADELNKVIITEGYVFFPGFGLGKYNIIRKKRKRPKIDWDKSNKKKAIIIAEGKIPYNKEKTPNGIKWLVYRDITHDYYWKWNKSACTLKNKIAYSFDPMLGNNGNMRQLYRYIDNNPTVINKYEEFITSDDKCTKRESKIVKDRKALNNRSRKNS